MVMIELQRRDPLPARNAPAQGPTVPLDHAILRILGDGEARELVSIRMALADKPSTHDLHARISTLVDKGLVCRTPRPGGPRRGPGASYYQLVPHD